MTVSVTDGTDAIEGVVVTLTKGNKEYSTSDSGTGAAGGATIKNVPYGTYNVTATKTGYNEYTGTYTVNESNHSIAISLTEE